MTEADRVQLEKDVLHEEHKTKGELDACVVQLGQMRERLNNWTENLGKIARGLDKFDTPAETVMQWRIFPDVDLKQVETACDEAINARARLDEIRERKKNLGL